MLKCWAHVTRRVYSLRNASQWWHRNYSNAMMLFPGPTTAQHSIPVSAWNFAKETHFFESQTTCIHPFIQQIGIKYLLYSKDHAKDTKANETQSQPTRDLKLVKIPLKQKYYWKQLRVKLPSIPPCCAFLLLLFLLLFVSEKKQIGLLGPQRIFSGFFLPAVWGL